MVFAQIFLGLLLDYFGRGFISACKSFISALKKSFER